MEYLKAFILFIGIFTSVSLFRTILLEITNNLDIFEGGEKTMNIALFTSAVWSLFYLLY